MVSCNICGEEFSRPDSLSRHQKRKYSCKVKNNVELELKNNPKQQSDATSHIDGRLETNTEENFTLKSKNPRLTTSVVNKIINTTPSGQHGSMIQPSIGNGKDNSIRNPDKVLTIHEAAKKLNIIPAYDSEGESIVYDEHEDDSDFENGC